MVPLLQLVGQPIWSTQNSAAVGGNGEKHQLWVAGERGLLRLAPVPDKRTCAFVNGCHLLRRGFEVSPGRATGAGVHLRRVCGEDVKNKGGRGEGVLGSGLPRLRHPVNGLHRLKSPQITKTKSPEEMLHLDYTAGPG